MYTFTIKLVYWQLLLYGVHVGHSFKNSIIFSGWMIYTYRQDILIINLFKTLWLLKIGYNALNASSRVLGPIWFINLNKSLDLYTIYTSKQAGEFSYVTYWIYGMISNWLVLGTTFRKLNRMISSAHKGQFTKLEFNWHPWLDSRISWPRSVFISSISSTGWPAKECLITGIPCLGICDSDISGHLANIPIPGNDDSLDSIIFFSTHISQYILEKKYGNISRWFYNVRRIKRIINFLDWIFINYINQKGLINWDKLYKLQKEKKDPIKKVKKTFFLKNINLTTFWNMGLKFFFSKNFGLNSLKEAIDIYDLSYNNKYYNIYNIFLIHKKNSIFLSKILSYTILKTAWKNKRFIKKKCFNNKIFKLRFMTSYYNYLSKNWKSNDNYFFQHYLNSKIYKIYLKNNKLRFNKFILHFIKFYYLKKYLNFRGFWSNYTLDLINLSSFSFILMSYCSLYFKNIFLKPLLRFSNQFIFFIKKKKIGISSKWLYYKYNINLILRNLLKNKKINKYRKFFIFYKTFIKNKKFSIKNIKNLTMNYVFFFHFYLWNKTFFKIRKNTQLLNKRIKFINKLEKNIIILNFIKNSLNSLKNLKYFYYNKNILNFNNINNKGFLSYFYLFNKNYFMSYFINNLGWTLDKFDLLRFKLKKLFYYNLNTQKYNKKILRWDKQKRFSFINNKPWFINTKEKILRTLYKPYKTNKFIFNLRKKDLNIYNNYYKNLNIKLNFYNKWKFYIFNSKEKINTFKKFFLLFKKFTFRNNKIYFEKVFKEKNIFKSYLKKNMNKNINNFTVNKLNKSSMNIYFYKNKLKNIYRLNYKLNNKLNKYPIFQFFYKNKIKNINNLKLNINFFKNIKFLLNDFSIKNHLIKKNEKYYHFSKLHDILKNFSGISTFLNKKRYLYKYKYLENELNFLSSSKDYYYYYYYNNNNNNNHNHNKLNIHYFDIYFNFFKYYKKVLDTNILNKNLYNTYLIKIPNMYTLPFQKKNYILILKYNFFFDKYVLNNSNKYKVVLNNKKKKNNLFLIKNLLYNQNWLLNKFTYFYLTKSKLFIKKLNIKKKINYYIFYYNWLIKWREKYKKLFW